MILKDFVLRMRVVRIVALVAALSTLSSCGAIRRAAVRTVAHTLSAPGSIVFTGDDDLELVGDAVPFGLKMQESLLEAIPDDVPLLVTTCGGFTQYSYVYVEARAEELKDENYAEHKRLNARALRLYLRARDYCVRGLEERFPGIRVRLLRDPRAALAKATRKDVPLLYWSAASWGAAVSLGIGRPDLAGDLHVVRGIAERALELDPAYSHGATHELMISLDSLDALVGGSEQRAREHFRLAVDLQKDQPQAGPYVALATGIALKKQDRAEFERLLKEALAIDPDKQPGVRLPNLAAQRRAQFLLDQIDALFPK